MADQLTVDVIDEPEHRRYTVTVDGRPAGRVDYRLLGSRLVVLHTEVDDEYTGRGVASRVVSVVLADIRRRGLTLTPACPFFVSFLRNHPDQQDLVDAEFPGGFTLSR